MTIRPIDTLIAHKAINLSGDLSNSDKRVAGAIIDHFNRKTAQCDPSLDSIAELIGVHRRTVIRAVDRLEKAGFIVRTRHGGKFHRNSYQPVWSRFRQIEAEWGVRRNTRRAKYAGPKLSPCGGQSSHVASDNAASQTLPSNSSYEISNSERSVSDNNPKRPVNGGRGSAREANTNEFPGDRYRNRLLQNTSSRDAARDVAERRWNSDLLSRYRDEPSLYGQIVEAVDDKLVSATTDAEFRQRGSGLAYLMGELLARDATLSRLGEKGSPLQSPTRKGRV